MLEAKLMPEITEHDFSEPEHPSDRDLVMAGMFTGLIRGLSNEDYHRAPGLSFSGLKEFAKTPAHYKAYLRRENEETSARRMGTGVHMRVLEPARFASDVVAVENRVTKANKELIADAEAKGKWVLTTKEYEQICHIGEGVLINPIASSLLTGGEAESSIFWNDKKNGVLLKCRPDYLRTQSGLCVDLKTFDDLDEESIRRQIYRMRYHYQSAFYLAGVNQTLGTQSNIFAHIFAQTDDPYLARVVVLNDASLDKATLDIEHLLERYAECCLSNSWPGYPQEIVETALPDFAW